MAGTASFGGARTVSEVPNSLPPRTTKSGHLHAVGKPAPIPVRVDGFSDPVDRRNADGAGLLQRLTASAQPVSEQGLLVARTLDRGRLCARELIDAVSFPPSTALAADVSRTGRVRLTVAQPSATVGTSAPVAGSSRAHVDARSQILVPLGLRMHLGIQADGEVIARVIDEHTVEILTAATLAVAINALDLVASYAHAAGSVVADRTISPNNHNIEVSR
jgi:hypothetical protein